MPSFLDSGFIVLLALLLFGPKKLPVLARQLGKLMADFRRASTEFRTQMEEELRVSEQVDRQKEIAAIEAAAPPTPALNSIPEPEHPHMPPPEPTFVSTSQSDSDNTSGSAEAEAEEPVTVAPLPIATSGDLSIMPPATGMPIPNHSISPFIDSIPEVPQPMAPTHAETNGASHEPVRETETRPWMI